MLSSMNNCLRKVLHLSLCWSFKSRQIIYTCSVSFSKSLVHILQKIRIFSLQGCIISMCDISCSHVSFRNFYVCLIDHVHCNLFCHSLLLKAKIFICDMFVCFRNYNSTIRTTTSSCLLYVLLTSQLIIWEEYVKENFQAQIMYYTDLL